MSDQQLNWQRYLLLARYHWKFLLTCMTGGLLLGVVLNLLVLHPNYSSNAKLLIKGGKTPTFVTQGSGDDQEVRALTTNGNPLLTQIEILNSSQLADQVIGNLKSSLDPKTFKYYQDRYPDFFHAETVLKSMKLKNPASTDIITLKLTTPDKAFSRLFADEYISSYQNFLQDINHESLHQHGKYIENQIKTTEDKLRQVRQELMQYRQSNQTIDLANEAQAKIQQVSDLETQRINLDSQISAHAGTIRNLKHILGMSTQQGVRSVALGMNTSLSDGQKALDSAVQDYQALSVKYTDTNPTMQAMKTKIGEIQKQLVAETQRTVGGSGRKGIQGIHIADPVRSNLVNNLASAESELQGLQAQRAALAGSLGSLKSQAQSLPAKQFHISELTDSEKVLSDMVNMLKQKAADAEFQASDELSNVVVVQSGTTALRPDFPGPKHILALMALMGLLGGMAWLLALEWHRMQALKPMEEHMRNRHPEEGAIYSS